MLLQCVVGPLTVEFQFLGFSDATNEWLHRRLIGFQSQEPAQIRLVAECLAGELPHRYGLLASSDAHVLQRKDLEIRREGDVWSGSIGDNIVALENVLRWTVLIELIARGGLLLHASSACFGDSGFLFLGESGRGKTTIVDSGQFDRVLCDEVSLLARDSEGRLCIWPSPFFGYARTGKTGQRVVLEEVFLLRGRDETKVTPASVSETVPGIFARVPEVMEAHALPPKVLDIASDVAAEVRGSWLSWRLGDDLRPVLLGRSRGEQRSCI